MQCILSRRLPTFTTSTRSISTLLYRLPITLQQPSSRSPVLCNTFTTSRKRFFNNNSTKMSAPNGNTNGITNGEPDAVHHIQIVKPEIVKEWMEKEATTTYYIDVRGQEELVNEGALPAPFICVPLPSLQTRHLPADKSTKIVFSCASGRRALKAANLALEMGWTNLYSMENAIAGWRQAGFPTIQGYIKPTTHVFFEEETATCQYVVVDEATKECAIIDSVLDFNPASGTISTKSADEILAMIERSKLNVRFILESHCHADHLSASQYLKSKLPGSPPVCIGANITQVQATFSKVFNINIPTDGSQFDKLWQDDEEFKLGDITCRAIHTPGHTPDSMTYIIGGSVYCGDTIFLPDVGSARCDFPAGSSKDLFNSVHERLFTLPRDFTLFVGHDYPPSDSRSTPAFSTPIGAQRDANKHMKDGTSLDQFTEWRSNRDATLGAPRLLMPSLQFNIRAGHFPEPDSEGNYFVKIPLKFNGKHF